MVTLVMWQLPYHTVTHQSQLIDLLQYHREPSTVAVLSTMQYHTMIDRSTYYEDTHLPFS